MTTFNTITEYIFTGSSTLIERTPEYREKTDLFLGHFIRYQHVVNHGDIYEDGRAVFEFGTINLGHYDYVKVAGNQGTA